MKFFSKLALGLLCLCLPATTFAHSVSQPPFIYINGKPTGYYTVSYASLPYLNLPQDLPTDRYVVNQSLSFKIDTDALPILPEELATTVFHWDFGDGTKADGPTLTHTYTKAGSYILTLTNTNSASKDPALTLDTVLMRILPNAQYVLPQPVILMNGLQAKAFSDVLEANFNRPVRLDASGSKPGTSPISSYTWDLGDQEISTDQSVVHSFSVALSLIQPVLRITDSQGFYVDTTLQLSDNLNLQASPPPTTSNSKSVIPAIALSVAGLAVLLGLGLWLSHRSNRPTPRKHR